MTAYTPRLPSPEEWVRCGVSDIAEVHAGKQSRVLVASVDGRKSAVKLTDRLLADRDLLTTRMHAAAAVATDLPAVVAPIRIAGKIVHPIGEWLMTATPFIDGDELDITNLRDARLMGWTLAQLHRALARLPSFEIPLVAALDGSAGDADAGAWQLLHGDFSDQNVVATPAGLRIFDFDDCGYGPIEYDVANSLYMVLFDAEVSKRTARYDAFRPAFVGGYVAGAGRPLADAVVDDLIGARIRALGRWLDDLSTAPIGIRTSSPAWLETLGSFVRSHTSSFDR